MESSNQKKKKNVFSELFCFVANKEKNNQVSQIRKKSFHNKCISFLIFFSLKEDNKIALTQIRKKYLILGRF